MINEDFLHFIWQFQNFNQQQLHLQDETPFSIIHPGEINHHAGPDFFNAQIRINDTRWAGNVEIHVKSSDWIKHGHQHDSNYNNVILHVVWEEDVPLFNQDGKPIPCFEISGRIARKTLEQFKILITSNQKVPCQDSIKLVDHVFFRQMFDRVLVERLSKKLEQIQQLYKRFNNWEYVLAIVVAKAFGFKTNADAMQFCVLSIPLEAILFCQNDVLKMEALLFGQAKLIPELANDDFTKAQKEQFERIKERFNLKNHHGPAFKWLRMRPANFPSIRISQLAAFLVELSEHTKALLNHKPLENHLGKIKTSEYWNSHYRFGEKSKQINEMNLGSSSQQNILINAIIPFLFALSKGKHDLKFQESAIKLLNELPAERNKITKQLESAGFPIKNAFDSQAAIELFQSYCNRKKCLNCSIANQVLKN